MNGYGYILSLWYGKINYSDGSMGMPKGPFNMSAIEVSKYKDGKAVEHWAFMDAQEMMKMMGNMGNMSHTDTTGAKK